MKWRSVLAARLSACDGRRGHSSPLSVFLFPKSRAHFRLSTFYPLSRLLPILTLLALMLALAPASPAYASAIVVTGKGDTIANDGICTLREAINAANNDAVYFNCAAGSGPDTITFAAPYVITLGSALPPISPSTQLTITGKGASATIIQANAAPNVATYRLFYVTSSATLTLQDLTVRNGRCNGSCATFPNTGGAIYNGGSLTLTRAVVSGNIAGLGGAIDNTGSLSINSSTLSGNSASDGGAIWNDASSSNLTISGSTLTGNNASTGGAISNGGNLGVTNSTFAANSAAFNGGGINNSGIADIRNSTFSGNSASPGAALSNFGTTTMYNSILANSTAGGDCTTGSPLNANVNNLIEDGSCSPALSGDPKLGPLGNNGGYTRTFPLQSGSPAIDAGNALTCAATDQRGYPRPQDGNLDGNAVCDIGAVEKLRWLTFRSVAAQDGWVLESSENSGSGGTLDYASTTFRLGDESGNRQYRGILSFNTLAIPDTAVVPRIILKIQRQSITGSNPFVSHGSLLADIRKGPLGGNAALQLADFSATANLNAAGAFASSPMAGNWYQVILKPGASPYVNKAGLTQFRLRFQLDDNNDGGADYVSFASGNFGTLASRPWLYVEYYIP